MPPKQTCQPTRKAGATQGGGEELGVAWPIERPPGSSLAAASPSSIPQSDDSSRRRSRRRDKSSANARANALIHPKKSRSAAEPSDLAPRQASRGEDLRAAPFRTLVRVGERGF